MNYDLFLKSLGKAVIWTVCLMLLGPLVFLLFYTLLMFLITVTSKVAATIIVSGIILLVLCTFVAYVYDECKTDDEARKNVP